MARDEHKTTPDDLVLDLDFVPQWARKPATENPYADRDFVPAAPRRDRGGPRDRGARGRSGGGPAPRYARGEPGRRRPPDRRREGRRRDDRAGPERGPPPPHAHGAQAGAPHRGREGGRPRSPARLPVEVSFIPERTQIGAAVRKIGASHRAYPLAELAHLFLTRETFHLVKIESRRRREGPATPALFQCRACGWVALDRDKVVRHVIGEHLESFFDVDEQTGDPPSGQFVCVARSTLDGTLLAPPNHHSFNERLQQLHDERYPAMPMEVFRARVEMVHEAEAVEQWRKEASVRRTYRPKDAPPDAPGLGWLEARARLESQIAPAQVHETHRALVPATVAREIADPPLRMAVQEAWTREHRFPMTLMMALRPALRHMGLSLFRAGDNHLFVTAVAPSPADPQHAIEPIRLALEYLRAHPGTTRKKMIEELLPDHTPDDPAVKELAGHLHWLVDKGYVIEFFDGTLAVPHGRRAVG